MLNICQAIEQWMCDRANNAIEPNSENPAFSPPLVGVGSGDDDLFSVIKNDIGPDFYWTPAEAFALAFPEATVHDHELSVIAWILPQTKKTRLAHSKATDLPSIEWSKARHWGEKVNERLRRFVVEWYAKQDIQGCSPVLLPEWSRKNSHKYGYSSSWSERHAAHVCGLGTFGMSDGLITPAGKAVRIGSVIVRHRLPPTPRNYPNHNGWCLYHTTGKCLVCARRCPAGAISNKGHDKIACKTYIRTITGPYVEQEQLGFKVNSCGLCQTKVPCGMKNPQARRQKKKNEQE